MTVNYVRVAELAVSAGTGWSLLEYDYLLINRLLGDDISTQQLDYPIVLLVHTAITSSQVSPYLH